jgi:hypothetical protein
MNREQQIHLTFHGEVFFLDEMMMKMTSATVDPLLTNSKYKVHNIKWGSRVLLPARAGIFSFTTASRPALEPTQPPIQGVPGALSLRAKRPGREADHSPPSSAEVKRCMELYLH